VPLIMAGAGIQAGQAVERFTEHVDLVPTILAVLGVPPPPGMRTDGRAQLTHDGVPAPDHGKPVVYYAWEEYRAVRSRRYLLRQELPGSPRARCNGDETLYRLNGGTRTEIDAAGGQAVAERLRGRLARRLDRRQRAFVAHRYDTPRVGFVVRPDYWRVGDGATLGCLSIEAASEGQRLETRGWLWSGRGVTVVQRDGERPLAVALPVPDGDYRVDLAAVPMKRPPWLFGYERWLRRSFLRSAPGEHVPLGTFRAERGELHLDIPSSAALGKHIVGIRLLPPGATDVPAADEDPELHRRLKALGYVE